MFELHLSPSSPVKERGNKDKAGDIMTHPQSCQTCSRFTLPHAWSKLKDCELTRGKLRLIPIGEEAIIAIVGCASHSPVGD